jgi:FKBP-type peptidyl-prolyl cis-trans isomerase SlyD
VLNLHLLTNKIPELMKIDQNKMVSLIYELRETNTGGKILEEIKENKPLKFLYGTGRLLPAFEANLLSLKSGDGFSFNLSSEHAYGERREEMIIDVPVSVFENNGKIDENVCTVGNVVPMMDGSGNQLNGIIYEISDSFVKMDFNHPMAGVELFFSGRILEVREPTHDELTAGASSCSGCEGHTHDHSDCGGHCS